jgi:hypothetical protein
MASLMYNVILLAVQSVSNNQGPPPPDGGGTINGPQAPIDDYLWVVLAIGLIYGIYIAYKRSRTTNTPA